MSQSANEVSTWQMCLRAFAPLASLLLALPSCGGKLTGGGSGADEPNTPADASTTDEEPASRLSVNYTAGQEVGYVRVSLADGQGEASLGSGEDVQSTTFQATPEEIEQGRALFSTQLIGIYEQAAISLDEGPDGVILSKIIIATIGERDFKSLLFDPTADHGSEVDSVIDFFEALHAKYSP